MGNLARFEAVEFAGWVKSNHRGRKPRMKDGLNTDKTGIQIRVSSVAVVLLCGSVINLYFLAAACSSAKLCNVIATAFSFSCSRSTYSGGPPLTATAAAISVGLTMSIASQGHQRSQR